MTPCEQSYCEIALKGGIFAKVDVEDFVRISRNNWKLFTRHGCNYAVRNSGGRMIFMHRVILGLALGDGKMVDHADGNGLNNQKSNIRIATYAQNRMNSRLGRNNTSGFKGVSIYGNKFKAFIKSNHKTTYLGQSDSAEGAAELYNAAAAILHGRFFRIQ